MQVAFMNWICALLKKKEPQKTQKTKLNFSIFRAIIYIHQEDF